MNWRQEVARYLGVRRSLGHKYADHEKVLMAFAQHAESHGDQFVCGDRMIAWAASTSVPTYARDKLAVLREFARWLHAEDERHLIPPRDALGKRNRTRPTPYLVSPKEIRRVMAAALDSGPPGSFWSQTVYYLIGLIASTGMRRSEAVSLRLADLGNDGLIIRESKFRKSRLVPIHASVRQALRQYIALRKQVFTDSDHLFVQSNGKPVDPQRLSHRFRELARKVGIRGKKGLPGPSLHSLRHSFAVRSLEEVAVGCNPPSINRHMLALTTYLGHGKVSSTQWYLEGTPLLRRRIAEAAERAFRNGTSDD